MLEVLEKPEARQLLHKLPVEEYFRIAEGLKTELLRGVIFDKMPKSQLHINFLLILGRLLREQVGNHFEIMSENPLALADSAPEPDLAIIDPVKTLDSPRFTSAHLVVEISVTTKAYDAAKADIYAEANIPVYWQILPVEKTTIVYSQPIAGKYTSVETLAFDAALTALLPGKHLTVRLSAIP